MGKKKKGYEVTGRMASIGMPGSQRSVLMAGFRTKRSARAWARALPSVWEGKNVRIRREK